MGRRAGTRRRETVFTGVGLDKRDQLADGLHRQRRIDREHRRRAHRDRDRIEVRGGVIGDVLVQRGINDVVRAIDENGVAVGCRLRGATRPNISARAGDILDIKLRPQLLGELLRHQASEYVGRAGGRERHDHPHRPGRITLCRGDAREKHGGSGGGEIQKLATRKIHRGPSNSATGGALYISSFFGLAADEFATSGGLTPVSVC